MDNLAHAAQPPPEAFVLIIGAGPVGMFAALSLARYGIHSIVVERQITRSDQPKSHALNPRTMEIMRQTGISTDAIRALGTTHSDADVVRWVESLVGIEYGNFEYECQGGDFKLITPEPFMNIAQPKLENSLAKIVSQSDLISIHRGWQWQSCAMGENNGTIRSVLLRLEDQTSITIDSRYLLACDGAHSRARAELDIHVEIPRSPFPSEMTFVSVEIRANWRKYKSGMLWILTTGNDIKTFIAYDRASCWVFMFGIGSEESAEKFTKEHCRSLIDKAVGEKSDYEIVRVVPWKAHLRIASNYRSKKFPNAFVLGDAAHAFPNAGGLGLNTGFADVHNLAWKIHAAEYGWTNSSDHLLDTYSTERKPIAEANLKQSDRNQFEVLTVSNYISARMMGNPSLHYNDAENKRAINKILAQSKHLKDHLNLQIGYVYGSSEEIPANACYYRPQCVPGGRLPHAWVRRGDDVVSVLDLVTGRGFVVLAGPDYPDLPTYSTGPGGTPISFLQLIRDFYDPEGSWSKVMNLHNDQNLVIVRPDQHILGQAASLEEVTTLLLEYLNG